MRTLRRAALLGAMGLAAALMGLPVLLLLLAAGAAPPSTTSAGTSEAALGDIPPAYLALYRSAAAEAGIDWAVLAAIGKIETDHGRSTAPGVRSGFNFHGCCAGPMQFYANRRMSGGPTTWDAYGVDGNADGRTDVYDPADAIPAAARYLAASGAPADYPRAIWAYNHSGAYVRDVLAQAARYRETVAVPLDAGGFVYPVRDPGGGPTGRFSDDYTSPRGSGGHCPDHPTWHCATDVFAPLGTPVVAPISGRLTRVGYQGLGGNRIWVEGPADRFYLAHLSRFASGLAEGLEVRAGQPLGAVGDTGSARGTPPHLHLAWERRTPSGAWVNANPFPLLRAGRG